MSAQEPTDTTKATQLQEVTVEGTSRYTSARKSSYVPTKKEKQASPDPVSLLARMQIPELNVDRISGSVKDLAQNDVPIFIDGHPANPQDLSGMRMNDVLRVEYLVNPAEPNFLQQPVVVNFIMKQYVWGGYTKLYKTLNWLPGTSQNRESTFAFSRYVRKKNSFDAWGGFATKYLRHFGNSTEETFRFPDMSVTRIETPGKSRMNENTASGGLQHTYADEKSGLWFSQFAVFSYLHTPLREICGDVSFSSPLYEGGTFIRKSPLRYAAPQYHATLSMPLGHGWAIHSEVDFSYKHENSDNSYVLYSNEPIINNSRNDQYSLRVLGNVTKRINDIQSISFKARGSFNWQHLNYSGNYPLKQSINDQKLTASAQYQLQLPKLQATLTGGADIFWRDAGGVFLRTAQPSVSLTTRYSFNNSNSVQFTGSYASYAPPVWMLDDHVIQKNELYYTLGNPHLKNKNEYSLRLLYTWMPSSQLYGALNAIWSHADNSMIPVYRTSDNPIGVIEQYSNDLSFNSAQIGCSLTYRILGGDLGMQVYPFMILNHGYGFYKSTSTTLACNVNAYYYLGSFNFSAMYRTPMKLKYDYGMEAWTHGYYMISAGWGKGNWTLSLDLINPFSRSWKTQTRTFDTDVFSHRYTYHNQDAHSKISFQAVYTFGYGKQVSHSNERRPD